VKEPNADLVYLVSALFEALTTLAWRFDEIDATGTLGKRFDALRLRAFEVGLAPSHRARVDRAQRERRLGELAEGRGDRAAAMLHYEAALAADPDVGVAGRLKALCRVD